MNPTCPDCEQPTVRLRGGTYCLTPGCRSADVVLMPMPLVEPPSDTEWEQADG